jgi:5-methyltetrahydrofolate--homocysteine methyltransferase
MGAADQLDGGVQVCWRGMTVRTVLEGVGERVAIDSEGPFVLIGERINPSGRESLAELLARGDMSLVREEALRQVEAGAQVIDVNVSAVDVDEEGTLSVAVKEVAGVVDVPICIDTGDHRALAAALDACPGRPLVNSVTGERTSLQVVLPLVRDRGCAVVGLCIDERGIPKDSSSRVEIAKRIVGAADEHGIGVEDVIIDPLAMAVASDEQAALVTLEAIASIRANLGVNTTLGGSNISFGLPERGLINRCFVAMCIAAGLTSALLNPLDVEIRRTVAVCNLLMGRDEYAMHFLQRSRSGW